MRYQAIRCQLEEVDAIPADWQASVTAPKLLERFREAAASSKGLVVQKALTIVCDLEIPEDQSAGGSCIGAFETQCVGDPEQRRVAVEFTLPSTYPDGTCCTAECTSTCFEDEAAQERFNESLAVFLGAYVGTPCLKHAVEFIRENVAYEFKRLYAAVFMDISIGDEAAGQLELELSRRLCPLTTDNFVAMCAGDAGKSEDCSKQMGYKGCSFWRIIPGQFCHSGDFTRGGLYGGSSNDSIFGGTFDDENFLLSHNRPGVLSMANSGPNTNGRGNEFFIKLAFAY
jgi:cyclophilin family peptidyl-prolyl cis-trans isomerase